MVRKANKEDAPVVLALMRELIEEHHSTDPYYKSFARYQGLRDYISDAVKDSDKILLVSEMDSAITGYFLGAIEEAPFYSSEKTIGVVADVCVSAAYRRRGILRQLFQSALAWFRKKGVNYIELSVDVRNKAAISAWKKLGFAEYKFRMKKSLNAR